MNPAFGIKGPELSETDLVMPMPQCVQIRTAQDEEEVRIMIGAVVDAANKNAIRQLKDLLGDQAPDLVEHLMKRLNVRT